MSSSGSNTGKVTTSRPTADAWCVLQLNSNSNPTIIDSVGISAAAYVQTGVVRVTFRNPERFASGAYVVLAQHELGNSPGYGTVIPQGSISSSSSVAVGLSGSCDISVIGFNSASAAAPTFATNTGSDLRPRVNLAFFCMRSDNDIRKTGLLNYGCDTQNMSITAPSGTSGGMQIVPGAGVAPDGTNTAVGIRVTANSLGTRKVIQYSIPSQFEVAGKAWNASIYIKGGDSGRVLRGASANVTFYDNSTGNSPSVRLNLDTGATAANTGTSDYVNHSIQSVGNGWYRVSLSSLGRSTTGSRNFYIGLSSNFAGFAGNETNWSGNGSIEAYLWGFQMEEGSAATPYISAFGAANPNLLPVPGDQDRLTVYSPGLTLSASVLLNTRTKREATAHGTIVIPPSRTATGVPYLENPYGVKAVRAVNASTYEVEFNPPMGNTGYCVLTSNEQETLATSEPASGEGSIPHTAEYGINTLRRVSALDDQRTLNAFRVSCLRQPTESSNPNLITTPYPTSLTDFPAPISWAHPAAHHTNTVVTIANEPNTSVDGALRASMQAISPFWVKCVKTNASNGIVAVGAPATTPLVATAYYRIKYYVMCNHPDFVSGSEISWSSDNNAVSQVITLGSYGFADKGNIRLIETLYQSIAGSNQQVFRVTSTLPIGHTFYVTGVQVHRVLPFEPRGDFYQSGREQRINFMVFGGRGIYGSE